MTDSEKKFNDHLENQEKAPDKTNSQIGVGDNQPNDSEDLPTWEEIFDMAEKPTEQVPLVKPIEQNNSGDNFDDDDTAADWEKLYRTVIKKPAL